jgi:predicted component of type VI protein secretion system
MSISTEGREALVHDASGMEFPLSRLDETMIGRKDPVTGIYPDIDLTPVDPDHSVARRNAKIYRRGTLFFVVEEIGAMTTTVLNGQVLDTGVPAPIRSGDALQVGRVILRFLVP